MAASVPASAKAKRRRRMGCALPWGGVKGVVVCVMWASLGVPAHAFGFQHNGPHLSLTVKTYHRSLMFGARSACRERGNPCCHGWCLSSPRCPAWGSLILFFLMSRLLFSSVAVALAALSLSACTGEASDNHPDQPVTKRRAVFKEMVRTLEPMGMVARDRKDYSAPEFLASAQALQKLSTQPWPFFTADSNYPPTHAKPEVWQKAADFKKAQDEFVGHVNELALAAAGDDLDRIKASVNQVQQSCKSCHDSFRNKTGD
jgi:cytochrome c556